ncbi:MAG: transposase [Ignavibacteriae bacterium]|nr:transposase [Ignavibacteriota bacterium]
MGTSVKSTPVIKKRTQKDYTLGFKLGVIMLVEKGDMTYKQSQRIYGIQGRSTVLVWLRRYGNLNWNKPRTTLMKTPRAKETPSQIIKRLEKELRDEKIKNMVLNKMIDISNKEYEIGIRKKFYPKQSDIFKSKKD